MQYVGNRAVRSVVILRMSLRYTMTELLEISLPPVGPVSEKTFSDRLE